MLFTGISGDEWIVDSVGGAIASTKHIQSVPDLTAVEAREFFDLVYRARWTMQMIEDNREVTPIQEKRSEHLHLWILPRYGWTNGWFNNSAASVCKMLGYMKENGKNVNPMRSLL